MADKRLFLAKEWLTSELNMDGFAGIAACINECRCLEEKAFTSDFVLSTAGGQATLSFFITDKVSLEDAVQQMRVVKQMVNSYFLNLRDLADKLPPEEEEENV